MRKVVLAQRNQDPVETIMDLDGFDRILSLLQMLHILSQSGESRVLSSPRYANSLRATDQERIGQVVNYIIEHFTEPIRLGEVAAVARMSETAFCRYFKERTNLAVFQFIAELRIGRACKLLIEKESSIARVASRCGYSNLSNFNRQFKAVSGMTPREYRRKYADALAAS